MDNFLFKFCIAGRRRTAALMAGPNPKKRKLNEVSNANPEEVKDGKDSLLKAENDKLKKAITQY